MTLHRTLKPQPTTIRSNFNSTASAPPRIMALDKNFACKQNNPLSQRYSLSYSHSLQSHAPRSFVSVQYSAIKSTALTTKPDDLLGSLLPTFLLEPPR